MDINDLATEALWRLGRAHGHAWADPAFDGVCDLADAVEELVAMPTWQRDLEEDERLLGRYLARPVVVGPEEAYSPAVAGRCGGRVPTHHEAIALERLDAAALYLGWKDKPAIAGAPYPLTRPPLPGGWHAITATGRTRWRVDVTTGVVTVEVTRPHPEVARARADQSLSWDEVRAVEAYYGTGGVPVLRAICAPAPAGWGPGCVVTRDVLGDHAERHEVALGWCLDALRAEHVS